jgi:hypothetical protein
MAGKISRKSGVIGLTEKKESMTAALILACITITGPRCGSENRKKKHTQLLSYYPSLWERKKTYCYSILVVVDVFCWDLIHRQLNHLNLATQTLTVC